MTEGTIVCIHSRYVIINDRRRLVMSRLLYCVLTGDNVIYESILSNIQITAITSRKPTTLLTIVRSNESGKSVLYCYGLPKLFRITLDNVYPEGTVILVAAHSDLSFDVERVYDNIRNRDQDPDVLLGLYLLTASSTILPRYIDDTSPPPPEPIDLSHLSTFTVDPTESRDFDDAISEDGRSLYVHIVDAHHQILQGSQEDINAMRRAFTLYLPSHVENILPSHRAENELSLATDSPRFVVTIEFLLDDNFSVQSTSLYRSVIQVKKRYDYQTFSSTISNYPLLEGFTKRHQRPSLAVPRVRYSLAASGEISSSIELCCDFPHKVIETAMVMTNLLVSRLVGVDAIPQRYHAQASANVITRNHTGNPAIDAILAVRHFRAARYEVEQSGHHGLGVTHYTHFTSPIRRYFDVVVHRLLAGVEYQNIEEILEYINQRERYIDTLSRLSDRLKMLSIIDRQPERVWPGYLTRVMDKGVVVTLEDFLDDVFVMYGEGVLYGRVGVVIKVDWETVEMGGRLSVLS